MDKDEYRDEREALIAKIRSREGTIDETEGWLQRLKEITWWFDSSDRMYYIGVSVEARRIEEQIDANLYGPPDRSILIDWVRRHLGHGLSEAEQDAYLNLVMKYVPHPAVSDLIYYSEKELTPEEVVDAALNYKPVAL